MVLRAQRLADRGRAKAHERVDLELCREIREAEFIGFDFERVAQLPHCKVARLQAQSEIEVAAQIIVAWMDPPEFLGVEREPIQLQSKSVLA